MIDTLAGRLLLAGVVLSFWGLVASTSVAAQDGTDQTLIARSVPLGPPQEVSSVTARPAHTAFPSDILARMRAEIIARTRRPAGRSVNAPTQQ